MEDGNPDDLSAYLKIGEDGRDTCDSGKIEMGQANTIALFAAVCSCCPPGRLRGGAGGPPAPARADINAVAGVDTRGR